MREIKFRLFDKISKKMYYDGILENGEMAVMCLDGKLQFSGEGTYKEKDFIKMLYIGLKDKKGKEIYEDDIIGFANEIGTVMWSNVCCNFCIVKINSNILCEWGLWWRNINRFEVIGNIYEKPELLKEV